MCIASPESCRIQVQAIPPSSAGSKSDVYCVLRENSPSLLVVWAKKYSSVVAEATGPWYYYMIG